MIPEKTTHLVILRLELHDSLALLFRGHLARLRGLETKLETLMALTQETRDILGRIDTATTAIAARLQTAIDLIRALESDAADEAEILGILTPMVQQLEALGRDPNNPVPMSR